jgi:hypothetical protein
MALGRPDAPVTLVEIADYQCPFCAAFARDALPEIVQKYVRTGKVRIEFRALAFIGPDFGRGARDGARRRPAGPLLAIRAPALRKPVGRERRLGDGGAARSDR